MPQNQTIVKVKRNTTENWQQLNPILEVNEFAVEIRDINTYALKLGDGRHRWSELDYYTKDYEQILSHITSLLEAQEIALNIERAKREQETNDLNVALGIESYTRATEDSDIRSNLAQRVSEINAVLAFHNTEILALGGAMIRIGTISESTSSLLGKNETDRRAALENRAFILKGEVRPGYVLQDSGTGNPAASFHYWLRQADGSWFDMGERSDINQATNSSLGIVQGTANSGTTRGKVNLEANGTMSVNGYDEQKLLSDKVDKTSYNAHIHNGADAPKVTYSNLLGLPTSMKNPQGLKIANKTYDGSTYVEISKDDIVAKNADYANGAGYSNQLQAFVYDDFTAGDHFIKAIREDGWWTRLKTCYNGGSATTNQVRVGYADSAGSAPANGGSSTWSEYANHIHVPNIILWNGTDLYNTVNSKVNKSGDTMTGALYVPTPSLP